MKIRELGFVAVKTNQHMKIGLLVSISIDQMQNINSNFVLIY